MTNPLVDNRPNPLAAPRNPMAPVAGGNTIGAFSGMPMNLSGWEDYLGRVARGEVAQEGIERIRGILQGVGRRDPEALNDLLGEFLPIGPVGMGLGALGHTVYHGSPHKFDRFDISKIGTGEGAQVYGHGLYFAESPGVARSYQQNITNPDLPKIQQAAIGDEIIDLSGRVNIDGRPMPTPTSEGVHTLYQAKMKGKDPQAEIDKIKKRIDTFAGIVPGASDYYGEVVRVMEKYKDAADIHIGYGTPPGSFYKVDIPDEWIPNMLDWDAPLTDQPEKVINKLFPERQPAFDKYLDTQELSSATGQDLWYMLNSAIGPDKAAAKLRSAGIPGIKYYDQMSRGAGKGTRNYVTFGDEGIKILERK